VLTKAFPAILIALLAVAFLLPSVNLDEHPDERMYVWKAAYYMGRLARLDFSPGCSYADPGWEPLSFWAVEQPWGSHSIYAVVLAASGLPGPAAPYSYTDTAYQGPETSVPHTTLRLMRVTAMVCAAAGLASICFRLGWPAFSACLVFLAIPHVRYDLARAWAEGPLLLGIGLCVLAYGSPLFTPLVGIASGLKLTALALWPVVWFAAPIRFRYLRHVLNVAITAVVLALTTPYSWLGGGPFYIVILLMHRIQTYRHQSVEYGGPMGFFLPSRYLWPIELAALLAIPVFVAYQHRRAIQTRPAINVPP